MALLECSNLHKRFDEPAVAEISLSLDRGRILCLLGPSGCGKTTLLRLIAGLEQPDNGRVVFGGKDVTSQPAHRRQFGMMFQDFALFPHKNVSQNVAFGLQMLNLDPGQVKQRTLEILNLVGLADLGQRNVSALSGGEKQRVALARSLAPRPRLLMLDEPMGSLDRALREKLLLDIRSILKQLDMTAIFVTHDQSEAFGVADEIAVMNKGRIVQQAAPEDLYRYPLNIFVAGFLGFKNLLKGSINTDGDVETALGVFHPPSRQPAAGTSLTLLLRPEGARLQPDGSSEQKTGIIRGRVVSRTFVGQSFRVKIIVADTETVTFDLPNHTPPPLVGHNIVLYLNPKMITVI